LPRAIKEYTFYWLWQRLRRSQRTSLTGMHTRSASPCCWSQPPSRAWFTRRAWWSFAPHGAAAGVMAGPLDARVWHRRLARCERGSGLVSWTGRRCGGRVDRVAVNAHILETVAQSYRLRTTKTATRAKNPS